MPQMGTLEGVCIDDRFVGWVGPLRELSKPLGPDLELVRRGHRAYEPVGLEMSRANTIFAKPY